MALQCIKHPRLIIQIEEMIFLRAGQIIFTVDTHTMSADCFDPSMDPFLTARYSRRVDR